MKVTGAELMVRTLRAAGVDVVAGIPGHTVASLANAVGSDDKLRPFLPRHEGAAAFAADVYFRVSGRLMALFTHSFPGATNALSGAVNAYADSSAMLLIVGETAGPAQGRGAYQELSRQFDADTAQLLRHGVKRVWQPRTALDLVDKTFLAVRTAVTGRPGPVALSVFQEIWDEEVEIPDWPDASGYLFREQTRPSGDAVEDLHRALAGASRPLIVAGNGVNLSRARGELLAVAEQYQIPVATTLTGKGAFPESHSLSLGVLGWTGTHPANWAATNADLIVCFGARLTETTSSSWQPGVTFDMEHTRLVQLDIDPAAIANQYPVDLALVGDAALTMQDLLAAAEGEATSERDEWHFELRQLKDAWTKVVAESQAPGTRWRIGVGAIVAGLRRHWSEPVNLVCDCGKHHKWIGQQFEARADDYIVSSVGGGTMGIGPLGAIGAVLARPSARTIAWTGDGGMSMSLFGWPTVAEHRFPITYVVVDDQSFGAVANIQEAEFGRTTYSTFDANGKSPGYTLDFAAIAQACGIEARSVTDPADLDDALAWAHAVDGPSVLDIRVDRRSVVPSGGGSYLHALWAKRPLLWAENRQTVSVETEDD